MKHLLLIICLFIAAYGNAQPFPVIHNSRPRILIDSSRIAWLRANMGGGVCGATYTDLLYRYTTNWITDPQLYQVGSDTTLWTWVWSNRWSGDQTLLSALIYRLSLDTLQRKRILHIVDHYIMQADTVNFLPMDWYVEETLLRNMSNAGDVLLDWCYDSIPVAKRQLLARSLYKVTREYMNKYILSSAGTSYVGSHNDLNCVYAMQNVLALHNADGLTILQNDTVNQWYDTVYNKWVNHFFPVYGHYRGNDGGWNWSGAYAMWSLTDQFVLFDNMLYGTGKNFYADLPWVQNSINQYWYFVQPNNNCINLGDGGTAITGDNVIYRHAAVYNDPRSTWLAQYYAQPSMLTWTMPVFKKLMYYDFTAPVVSKPTPPLDWWAVHKGLVMSRTSWDSSSTVLWHFNSWSKKNNHEHLDNNTFSLFRHKPLIIDAGDYDSYGSSHYNNYYIRTIAHNSVCVFDSADHYSIYSTPVSNDGGQQYGNTLISYADIFAPQNQKGVWLRYAPGNNYTYSIADAALAYDTAKLDRFVRRIFFDKPDHIIVLDHLHLKNIATAQRDVSFLLHFTNQPTISGIATSTAVPGHITTHTGRDYSAVSGGGNIAVRTLLPDSSNTTLIGGTGYEYWVNGVNYPPSVAPDTLYQTPGKWRIEVRPNTISDSLIYLHTIKVGDSANVAAPGGISQKNNYSIGVDWDNTLYYFNAHGDTSCNYHVLSNIPGGRTGNIIACDLKRTILYDVKINGVVVTTAVSDTNGVLKKSVILPPGLCLVEITQDVTNIIPVAKEPKLYEIFPNPAAGIIFIKDVNDRAEKPIQLTIFNLNGLKISGQNTTSNRWSQIDLPAGVYIFKINDGNKTYSSIITITK